MKLIINLKKPIFDNNKIIKFETKYIYEINIINDIIIGGDIFDDINIDDIIIKKDEEPIKIITDSKKNIGEIDSKILKKHNIVVNKKNNITTFKMSKLKFSMLNSIYDIKLLLYYMSLYNSLMSFKKNMMLKKTVLKPTQVDKLNKLRRAKEI